jgi:hypothetical protein
MLDLLNNEMVWWLLGTAVVFTMFGRYMALKSYVNDAVAATIDTLIKDGYLKTRGSGKNMEIIKWRDWNNEQTDRT